MSHTGLSHTARERAGELWAPRAPFDQAPLTSRNEWPGRLAPGVSATLSTFSATGRLGREAPREEFRVSGALARSSAPTPSNLAYGRSKFGGQVGSAAAARHAARKAQAPPLDPARDDARVTSGVARVRAGVQREVR